MEPIGRNKATKDDIRRIEDAPVNILTGEAWPEGHKKLLEDRRKLPVYGQFKEILDKYHGSQAIILSSETGSGKSTQVPQLLTYDELASGKKIACTQPRRLATTELAERVAEEMGVQLGDEVGYMIGGDAKVDQEKTRLVYMTEGVILKLQESQRNLDDWSCIIIDEAHERTSETDILLAILKKIMSRRKDFKVVIMSATLDAARFQDYFGGCPAVNVLGRNFKVDIRYVEQPGPDFCSAAARLAVQVHRQKGPGDILVFLPGEGEINKVCRTIQAMDPSLDVEMLYGQMASRDSKSVMKSGGARRKCIVATNVAETSVTFPGVVYVIDSGCSRRLFYNARLGMEVLQLMPISQASARQRAGRAGRVRAGVCYRLYSKEDFDGMDPTTEPAIRQVPFHGAALKLIVSGYNKLMGFDWIDAPHPESVERAFQDLCEWGFISKDGAVTKSGRFAAGFPLGPAWYHALEVADKLGCSQNMVDLAVANSTRKPIFMRPPMARPAADYSIASFHDHQSDHIALEVAFCRYLSIRDQAFEDESIDLDAWCLANLLDISALEDARLARDHLKRSILRTGMTPTRVSAKDLDVVRKALAMAFPNQVAVLDLDRLDYRTVYGNTVAQLSPLSCLETDKKHQWVVYSGLERTAGRTIIRTATAIKPEWLLDLPYFQDDQMPLTGDGFLRMPVVKEYLDAARAKTKAPEV